MLFRLLLLLLSLLNLDNVISISTKPFVFNNTINFLPAYYKDITNVKDDSLILKPTKKGKMLRLVRQTNDPIKFSLHRNPECLSQIHFYFPQKKKSKFCLFVLDITKFSIELKGNKDTGTIMLNGITKMDIAISNKEFKLQAFKADDGTLIERSQDGCELNVFQPGIGETMFADFYIFDTNDCGHELALPDTSRLAIQYVYSPKVTTTTTKSTSTTQKTTVTTKKTTTATTTKVEEETDNAELALHWYIIILIAEIILCIVIGAALTWLYITLTKRFKIQQPSSLSVEEDSQDEEIETALEDLQATTAQPGDGVNGSKSTSKTTAGSVAAGSRGSKLQTARPPLNNNNNQRRNDDEAGQQQNHGPNAPAQPQKSKKSFLERMSNKFKRKNKEPNSKKFFLQQPQISVSGFSSSTTMNIPFGESKEIAKARGDKTKPPQEQKKSVKKIKAHAPFSKEFGIDQQGCEPTQASREESYEAEVANVTKAKKNAEMHARMFTHDGKMRNAKELAEYDAQKAAAAASTKAGSNKAAAASNKVAGAGSTSKKR